MSSDHPTVNISGLPKAAVLAALYNASSPAGMGFFQAGNGPQIMDERFAQELIDLGSDASGDYPEGLAAMRRNDVYYDYLYGRPLKLDLSSDEEFDPWGFDRDNGGTGTAQRIVDELRATGDVNPTVVQTTHGANAEDKFARGVDMAFDTPDLRSGNVLIKAITNQSRRDMVASTELPDPPKCSDGRQYLNWSADEALKYYDENPQKSIAIFLDLVQRDSRTRWIASASITEFILLEGLISRDRMDDMMKGFAA